MTKKEAYIQKLKAELELAQAELAKLRAQVKVSTANARITCFKHIDHIEELVDVGKKKLEELGASGEDAWENLKSEIEMIWAELSNFVQDTGTKINDESSV